MSGKPSGKPQESVERLSAGARKRVRKQHRITAPASAGNRSRRVLGAEVMEKVVSIASGRPRTTRQSKAGAGVAPAVQPQQAPHADDLAAIDPRLPLFQRLAGVLRNRIHSREWGVGSVIASEQELAAYYGLSLGTVRRAVEELVAEGLLQRRQGSGTYVRRPQLGGLPTRFFDMPATARSDIPESRILGITAVKPTPDAVEALGMAPREQAIRIDRLRVWAADLIIAEHIYLRREPFEGLLKDPSGAPGTLLYPYYEARFGIAVNSVEEELTFSTADSTIARLLGIKTGAPVLVITRTASTFDGRAVEWRVSYGRADRFRYRVGTR
jgi:GntR family transcriptional regulator